MWLDMSIHPGLQPVITLRKTHQCSLLSWLLVIQAGAVQSLPHPILLLLDECKPTSPPQKMRRGSEEASPSRLCSQTGAAQRLHTKSSSRVVGSSLPFFPSHMVLSYAAVCVCVLERQQLPSVPPPAAALRGGEKGGCCRLAPSLTSSTSRKTI